MTNRIASTVECVPDKGNWQGGENVIIVMPKPIKGKGFKK